MKVKSSSDVDCRIERLRADDLDALAEHLVRLDATDRRNRFGMAMTDRSLVDFARHCDPDRDIVVVLKRGTRVEGVCQLAVYRAASGLPVAELGISVDATMRRAGWATGMLGEALRIALQRGVVQLVVNYLRRNRPMAALVRSLGDASEEVDEDGVIASLPLFGANDTHRVAHRQSSLLSKGEMRESSEIEA